MKKTRVLFLYTELAGYVTACLHALVEKGIQVHVVRYPVNKEAPFEFAASDQIHYYERPSLSDHALMTLAEEIDPDLILCSGWVDRGYLQVCKKLKKKRHTVLLLDNQWEGSLKQIIAALVARFGFIKHFSHAWVPGAPQSRFARKLGFSDSHIKDGFYCADTRLFSQVFNANEDKPERMRHRFIYVGRYLAFKGIEDLWTAFIQSKEKSGHDWELYCVGTGDLYETRIHHPQIHHLGFLQPQQLTSVLSEGGVFVLPSHKEPWGVVVHEMAAAGLPLICSHKIGAATRFLQSPDNGLSFEAGNVGDLERCLTEMSQYSDAQLFKMRKKSQQMALELNTDLWVRTLLELL